MDWVVNILMITAVTTTATSLQILSVFVQPAFLGLLQIGWVPQNGTLVDNWNAFE